MADNLEYSSSHISTSEGLAAFRKRPTQYVPRGTDGITHTIKEVTDNSNDELSQYDTGTLTAVMFRDRVRGTFQILIHDNGRGIPAKACKDCIVRPGTSGKLDAGGAYACTGGLFGVGGKVAPALSSRYKVLSRSGEGTFQMYLRESEIQDEYLDLTPIPRIMTGTTIVMEFDPAFFEGIPEYMESTYLDLVALFRTWNIFNGIRYVFKISEHPLPEAYWAADVTTTLALADAFVNELSDLLVEYDSDNDDPRKAMLDLFQVGNSPIIWETELERHRIPDDRLSYRIRMLVTKKLGGGCIHLLNNIVVSNSASDHITGFYRALDRKLVEFIERDDLKNFFMSSGYTLPIYVMLNIKYDQAEFTGTTKESFKDRTFNRHYADCLKRDFDTISVDQWKKLVGSFIQDLEDKFNFFHGKRAPSKDQGLLTTKLNKNTYLACEVLGPDSELIMTEGSSASGISPIRNVRHQALLALQGKLKNAVSAPSKRRKSIADLMKDQIWQDFVTIAGITPGSDDLSGLNFGRYILATDADPDGGHIRSTFLGNVYTLSPAFVNSGRIYIATPPLYVVTYGKNNAPIYLRDRLALYDMRINLAYSTLVNISIRSPGLSDVPLKDEAYREFCHLVLDYGECMVNSAKILCLPPLLLERLIFGLQYIVPRVDINGLKNHFGEGIGHDNVYLDYLEDQHAIMMSVGATDYPIILTEMLGEIRKNLLPRIKAIRAQDWHPVVTSTLNPKGVKNKPCSLMQLFLLFEDINQLFKIDRKKGLGEMELPDLFATVMNPQTRSLIRVCGMNDDRVVYELLGPDSAYRKQLLAADGGIDYNFERI